MYYQGNNAILYLTYTSARRFGVLLRHLLPLGELLGQAAAAVLASFSLAGGATN